MKQTTKSKLLGAAYRAHSAHVTFVMTHCPSPADDRETQKPSQGHEGLPELLYHRLGPQERVGRRLLLIQRMGPLGGGAAFTPYPTTASAGQAFRARMTAHILAPLETLPAKATSLSTQERALIQIVRGTEC